MLPPVGAPKPHWAPGFCSWAKTMEIFNQHGEKFEISPTNSGILLHLSSQLMYEQIVRIGKKEHWPGVSMTEGTLLMMKLWFYPILSKNIDTTDSCKNTTHFWFQSIQSMHASLVKCSFFWFELIIVLDHERHLHFTFISSDTFQQSDQEINLLLILLSHLLQSCSD